MRINHNIAALNTYRQLSSASGAQAKSMEKLSSGLRINKAGDDAAGLAISEKMRGQIRGLDQASRNAQDGISMIQTAEGALNETHSILQRTRELAVQASNDTLTQNDRDEIQKEVNQLTDEINRISNTTEFNTKKLLNGDLGAQTVKQSKVFTSVANAGTSAALTATDALAGNSNDLTAGTIGSTMTVSLNGVDSTITLTNVNTLGATHDASTPAGQTAVMEALQEDFNTSMGAGKVTVSLGTGADAGKLILTTAATGSSSSVMVQANAATDALGITADASTNSALVNGTDSTYNAASTTASTTTTLTLATAGITNTDTLDVRFNGTTSSVQLTATAANHANMTDLVNALQSDINSEFGANTIAVSNDNGKIKLTAVDTTAASTIEVVSGGSLNATKELGFATNSTDNNATIQIGANAGQNIKIDINNMSAQSLGLTSSAAGVGTFDIEGDGDTSGSVNGVSESAINYSSGNSVSNNGNTEFVLSVSSQADANNAIEVINKAINTVSTERSKLGAFQNRLEHTINNLNTSSENLTASESRIRDVDMASEMMNQTKNSILSQAAQAMLAQSNQMPQGVLQLLR